MGERSFQKIRDYSGKNLIGQETQILVYTSVRRFPHDKGRSKTKTRPRRVVWFRLLCLAPPDKPDRACGAKCRKQRAEQTRTLSKTKPPPYHPKTPHLLSLHLSLHSPFLPPYKPSTLDPSLLKGNLAVGPSTSEEGGPNTGRCQGKPLSRVSAYIGIMEKRKWKLL